MSLLPSFQSVNCWSLTCPPFQTYMHIYTTTLISPVLLLIAYFIFPSPRVCFFHLLFLNSLSFLPNSRAFSFSSSFFLIQFPMTIKRMREGEHESVSIANCLMLLSRGNLDSVAAVPARVFECKTCNRQFPSFQALGGHRASHKKPRLMGLNADDPNHPQTSPSKPKTHECSICGLEFAIGQALGGHMRRHRAAPSPSGGIQALSETTTSSSPPPPAPVLKKPNSRRVLCLDLNLTPLENIDLQFQLGKMASTVDCFP